VHDNHQNDKIRSTFGFDDLSAKFAIFPGRPPIRSKKSPKPFRVLGLEPMNSTDSLTKLHPYL
jgi:hypothetical protein